MNIDFGGLIFVLILSIPLIAIVLLDRYGLLPNWFGTPSEYDVRLKREAQRKKDIEEFNAMTPEQRQLHLNAKHKVAQFKFSIFLFAITCIFSGAIIYYVNWVM
jgi:hypothetical protein